MKSVAVWAAVSLVAAVPALVSAGGDYDPCKNRGPRRIAIVYARSSGALSGDGECKGSVHPAKKTVCVGDTVEWAVVNTCDVEEIFDIRLSGLERVTEGCTTLRRLGTGGAQQIRCRVARRLREDVRQDYDVAGVVRRSRTVIDPELDIRTPR